MSGMAQSESSIAGLNSRVNGVSVDPKKSTRYLSFTVEILAVAAVYFAAAKIGLSFAYINASVSPVWRFRAGKLSMGNSPTAIPSGCIFGSRLPPSRVTCPV